MCRLRVVLRAATGTGKRQLYRRQAVQITWLAKRLREAITAGTYIDEIIRLQRRIDLHQITLHLVDGHGIRFLLLRMLTRDVEGHIDDVIVQWSQIGVLEGAGNIHLGVIRVQPEALGYKLLQLRDDAHHLHIFDTA